MNSASISHDPSGEDWVTIAHIVRARGNRGEVSAISLTSHPERYQTLDRVYVFGPQGPMFEGKPVMVESVWPHQDRMIFKLQGVDSITDAEQLAGAELRIPLQDRPPLPPGEYYHSDLVGCQMVERKTGEVVGLIRGWQEIGPTAVLEVKADESDTEILVPFAREICVEIDLEARQVRVDLPEGLKELNRR